MKALAFFLLFLTASATGRPNEVSWEQSEERVPANGGWFSVDGLLSNVKGYLSTISNALVYNGTMSDVLSSIGRTIHDKIAQGGKITENLLARLVVKTLNTAVTKNIITADVALKIKATFNMAAAGETQPLELGDIENVQIEGDAGKAAQFREALVYLIQAKNEGDTSTLQLLAVLECELIDLLAGNAIISAEGAHSFISYFNLDSIVKTIKNPKPALNTMTDYYTNNIQPQIIELSQSVYAYLVNLKNLIIQSPVGQEMAQKAPELLDASVKYLSELKNEISQNEIFQRIIAESPEFFNSSLNFMTDMKTQISQKAPEMYAEYLKYIDQLKTQIVQSELAGKVAEKAPELYQEYLKYLSDLADQIAHSQIVQNVIKKTPEYLNATVAFLNQLKTQLAQKAPPVYHDLKNAVQAKLAAGGELTKPVLIKVMRGLLGLTAGELLNSEDVARLEASFGIDTTASAIEVDQVDTLVIKGDQEIADELRSVIKTELESVATDGVSVSNLLHVNLALLEALASNRIINVSVSLGLKTFLEG